MKGFVALALGLTVAPCSFAAFFNNSTGLASPASVITFSEIALPPNAEILSVYSGLGVTFSPGVRYDPSTAQGTPYPNFGPNFAGNFGDYGQPIATSFSIFFLTPRSSAAFALATQSGATTVFEALLSGVVQESASRVTTYTSSQNYFGFTGVVFDQIRITEFPGTPDENGSAAFDNIQLDDCSQPTIGRVTAVAPYHGPNPNNPGSTMYDGYTFHLELLPSTCSNIGGIPGRDNIVEFLTPVPGSNPCPGPTRMPPVHGHVMSDDGTFHWYFEDNLLIKEGQTQSSCTATFSQQLFWLDTVNSSVANLTPILNTVTLTININPGSSLTVTTFGIPAPPTYYIH